MLLDRIPENRETCFICGRAATTNEHVFPKWLQHRFNLWDQRITLPNGTRAPYRTLLVPACAKCNNEVYGQLERRVEAGNATEADVWRWANKIHYALGYKDRVFEWDRKNAGRKIGEVISSDDPVERSRHSLHAVSGDFRVDPDPFGSVFRFEFSAPQEFAFAHLIASNSICVSIGNVGYAIFVIDGQALKRDRATQESFASLAPRGRKEDMLFFYAQCVEHLARHKLGQDILMSKDYIIRLGRTVVHDVEPLNKERFRQTCAALGLNWINNEPATIDEGKETVLHVLRERKLEIPTDVEHEIANCQDMTRIRRWIDRVGAVEAAFDLLAI